MEPRESFETPAPASQEAADAQRETAVERVESPRTAEQLMAHASQEVREVEARGVPVAEDIAARMGVPVDAVTREGLAAIAAEAQAAARELGEALRGESAPESAVEAGPIPKEQAKEVAGRLGSWASSFAVRLNAAGELQALAQTEGLPAAEAAPRVVEEGSRREREKMEGMLFGVPIFKRNEAEELAAITPESVEAARAYLMASDVPDAWKTAFARNVDVVRVLVGSGVFRESMARAGALSSAELEVGVSSEEDLQAQARAEVVVALALPVFDALAGASTERVRAEYREKHLLPTVRALKELLPNVDPALLDARAEKFTFDSVMATAGKRESGRLEASGGVYHPDDRAMRLPLRAFAEPDLATHIIAHETLHALSHGEGESRIVVKADEGIPVVEAAGKDGATRNYPPNVQADLVRALTEALTEKYTIMVMRRRGSVLSPDKFGYKKDRAVLDEHLGAFDAASGFGIEQIAPAYFADDKNIATVWPKATESDPRSLSSLMRGLDRLRKERLRQNGYGAYLSPEE
jgi:hypothetical protein